MSVLALPNKTVRTWERVDQLEEHPSVRRLMHRLNQRDGVSIAAVEASLRQGANAQLFALKTIDILERETAKAVVTIFAVDEASKIAGVSAIAAERGANKEMLRRFRCAAYEFIVRTGARIIFALTAEDNFEDRQVLEDLGFRRVSYAVNAQ